MRDELPRESNAADYTDAITQRQTEPLTRYNRRPSRPAHRIVGSWPPRRDMSEERPSQQEVLQNLILDNGLETVDAVRVVA